MRTCTVLLAALVASSACGKDEATPPAGQAGAPTAGAPPADTPPPTAPAPVAPPAPAVPQAAAPPTTPAADDEPCKLLSRPDEALRPAGKAKVLLTGAVTSELADAPAVCGAFYVKDGAMGKTSWRAGDGLLFETCTPEGLIQISSEDGRTGTRGKKPGDITILFNPKGGGSYVYRSGGKVAIGDDLRTAKAKVDLEPFGKSDEVELEVEFDCR